MDKTCKYYKYQKYVSYDNGETWQPLSQFQRGELMEFNSPDCGGGTTLYKWVVVEGEFSCEGYDKYELTQKYVSYDGGGTWSPISGEYSIGSLIEHNSVDCGYVIYDKWRWVDTEDFICIEEEDCDVDYINELPQNIGSIRDSGTSISQGCITASDVKGEEYSASTKDSPTKDLVLNTSCMETDIHGNYPMTYMTRLTALTVTNNVATNSSFPPYDSAYNGIVGIYGCNVNYPHLFGMFNILFSDSISNLGCKGRPQDSYCELSYSYVKQEKLIEYRGNFTSSNYLIFPMNDIMKYFNLWFIPKYKFVANSYWCDDFTKKEAGNIYMSLSGTSYTSISPYSSDTIIEIHSSDCGYQTNILSATYNDSTEYFVPCSAATNGVLTREIVRGHTTTYTLMTSANVLDCCLIIGDNAFNGCYNLTSCTINSSVTSIGAYAFRRCFRLTNVNIPSGVTSIGNYAFSVCHNITNINIPNGVTSIGAHTFEECSGLTSVTIGNSVTSIGDNAFKSCSSLASINVPDSVTSIGAYAFQYCENLTSIDIPSGITSIRSGAFATCSRLTSVTVLAATPPTLGSSVFNNTNNCTIYVPSASVETYKTASGWSSYASMIQAMPNS